MGDEEVNSEVKDLFDNIWEIERLFVSSQEEIIAKYKSYILEIIKKAKNKFNEFSNTLKDTTDKSVLKKTIGLGKDIEYIIEDLVNIKNEDDIYNFFTKMKNFQKNNVYDERSQTNGGRRCNHPKHTDMKMKDIKELCNANQIKLSKVVGDKRVVYKKKELITKLKRKKVI